MEATEFSNWFLFFFLSFFFYFLLSRLRFGGRTGATRTRQGSLLVLKGLRRASRASDVYSDVRAASYHGTAPPAAVWKWGLFIIYIQIHSQTKKLSMLFLFFFLLLSSALVSPFFSYNQSKWQTNINIFSHDQILSISIGETLLDPKFRNKQKLYMC